MYLDRKHTGNVNNDWRPHNTFNNEQHRTNIIDHVFDTFSFIISDYVYTTKAILIIIDPLLPRRNLQKEL